MFILQEEEEEEEEDLKQMKKFLKVLFKKKKKNRTWQPERCELHAGNFCNLNRLPRCFVHVPFEHTLPALKYKSKRQQQLRNALWESMRAASGIDHLDVCTSERSNDRKITQFVYLLLI